MNRLGISLYPNISNNIEKDKAYIELAYKYGFKRIFMCMLNVDEDSKELMIQTIQRLTKHAKKYQFEIIIDLSSKIMKELNLNQIQDYLDLGMNGIRLDEGMNGQIEAEMTKNNQNFKIEINASSNELFNSIIKNKPNFQNLIACHNYYPLKYTGLSIQYFNETSKILKDKHIQLAAFVTSQEENTFGPWDYQEGMCTLEIHRTLPIDIQVKHLIATQMCDDIIIGNTYASEDELKACSEVILHPHTLQMIPFDNTTIENKIMNEHHVLRKDKSEFVLRSTYTRIKYKKDSIPPKEKNGIINKGSIIIINNKKNHYKGELHIVLQDIENDGSMNLVGKIIQDEMIMLDTIHHWNEIDFIRKESK